MSHRTLCALGAGAALVLVLTVPPVRSETAPAQAMVSAAVAQRQFLQLNPRVKLAGLDARISRVYGTAFAHGQTAVQSAQSFVNDHSAIFGVPAQDLAAVGPFIDGRHTMGLMYNRRTETYKFTGVFYTQQRAGIPVFRSSLRLLVRNEPGFPLVLAAADLRDLGGFQVAAQFAADVQPASRATALARAQALTIAAGQPRVISSRKVIFAGNENVVAVPTLADETIVGIDFDEWLILTDAATGIVLFEENLVYDVDIDGHVQGLATEGVATDQCEEEVAMPLPYLQVTSGINSAFSDVNGDFTLPNAGAGDVTVDAILDGQWFDVTNFAGENTSESVIVTPPGPANLEFNSANDDEQVRAEVNAYVYVNVIRDFVLSFVPDYPGVAETPDFPVGVNRTDGFCPGNAWYKSAEPSINFCLSAPNAPNTAWSSVVYHEYGHHLVAMAGSGQCQYGEGMSDVMSILILDDPRIGVGFFVDCDSVLRNADNDCQYSVGGCSSCGGPCHNCGQLLSGVVWDLRNALEVTEPVDFHDIVSALAINAMFLHTGTSIAPDIVPDYLTLDDDDADLCNGTPHSTEITMAFEIHGLLTPILDWSFPAGFPDLVSPAGVSSMQVTVDCSTSVPEPDTGILHVDTGSGFVEVPMTENAPNEYEAQFPTTDCGTEVFYYFSAETSTGAQVFNPSNAPTEFFRTIAATSLVPVSTDDFENDLGWTVQNSPGLTGGGWERGVPTPLEICDNGNPGTDGDGSGQCYLTEISTPEECNTDVDDGATRLTSPVLDATQGEAYIRYWRWYSSRSTEDFLDIEISDDGGGTFAILESLGATTGGWVLATYKIGNVITPTNQFQIRYTAADNPGHGDRIEAGVDGVQILDAQCAVFGDLDDDGIVGITDFLLLLSVWGPCPEPCPPFCVGDLDQDCNVGITDFLLVLSNWT